MKTLALFFITLHLLHTNSFAQEVWQWQNPVPQGNSLKDIQYLSDNMYVAVVETGTIIKTIDDGNTWLIYNFPSDTFINLNSLYFINAHKVWAVGSPGVILFTSDGGDNWEMQESNINGWLTSVHFISEELGWIVGSRGLILKTTNGGNNWDLVTTDIKADLNAVFFTSSQIGFTVGIRVGIEKIFRTTDGGYNWLGKSIGLTNYLAVNFTTANIGWVVGWGGDMVLTTDGGDNWINQSSVVHNDLHSIFFLDENDGWIAGYNGTLLLTTDGGID